MIPKQQILNYLTYSEQARLGKDELEKIYPESFFLEDTKTNTQGFVLFNSGELIVSFRGTQQLQDWLTDFNAFHMIYPYDNLDTKIMVHRGFMMAYLSVRKIIHCLVDNYSKSIKTITCTGHSLGGALATLCAVDMQYNFKYPVQCYASGNPMVGNKYFVKSYDRRVPNTTRTYMRKDPVPYLPPKWFEKQTYEGYTHCGNGIPIGPMFPFYGLVMLFRKIFKRNSILDDIFNHDIGLYRDEVNKLKQ